MSGSSRPSTSSLQNGRRKRQFLTDLDFEATASESDFEEIQTARKNRRRIRRHRGRSNDSNVSGDNSSSSQSAVEEEERAERKKLQRVKISRQLLDIFAPIAFLAYLVVITYISSYYVNPWLYAGMEDYHTAALWAHMYALVMVMFNWLLVCLVKTSLKPTEQPDKPTTFGIDHMIESLYCETCNQAKPLRVHHCFSCNACIETRELHCHITSCCIGLRNLKFFLSFLLWHLIVALYCLVTITIYIRGSEWRSLCWYTYILAPIGVAEYLFGLISSLEFLVLLALYCLIAAVGYSAYMLAFHIYIAARGQTTYEYKYGHRPMESEDRSGSELLTALIGPYWWVQLLLPVGIIGLIWSDSNNHTSDKSELAEQWVEDDVQMLL